MAQEDLLESLLQQEELENGGEPPVQVQRAIVHPPLSPPSMAFVDISSAPVLSRQMSEASMCLHQFERTRCESDSESLHHANAMASISMLRHRGGGFFPLRTLLARSDVSRLSFAEFQRLLQVRTLCISLFITHI